LNVKQTARKAHNFCFITKNKNTIILIVAHPFYAKNAAIWPMDNKIP
jgi:transposase-like protein